MSISHPGEKNDSVWKVKSQDIIVHWLRMMEHTQYLYCTAWLPETKALSGYSEKEVWGIIRASLAVSRWKPYVHFVCVHAQDNLLSSASFQTPVSGICGSGGGGGRPLISGLADQSPAPPVQVTLGKTLNPHMLPMCKYAPKICKF